MIKGTDTARLRSYQRLANILKRAGIQVAVAVFGEDYYVTRRLEHSGVDYVPPLEVIVKARHVGTPKHNLYDIDTRRTLNGARFLPNQPHAPYVRFDYTNPLTGPNNERLRDE